MQIEGDRFEVRLAETADEVRSAQRLRYRVFVEEMGAPAPNADASERLESDIYDKYVDHLILIDRFAHPADPLDRVIGVYRLLRKSVALAGPGFYGAGEYDLSHLIGSGREILELGRSCVAKEYRRGVAMHLLWNGLADYVGRVEAEILFGVASFHGTDPQEIAHALSFLNANHLAPPDLSVTALPPNATRMDLLPPDQIDRREAMRQTPALIKAYLRLGGFVGDGAYVDRAFNTIDVCLLMDTARMTDRYRNYYARDGAEKAE